VPAPAGSVTSAIAVDSAAVPLSRDVVVSITAPRPRRPC
jgi:hypothetical protein